MKLETLAIHAGRAGGSPTGAVAPPIVLSTTFERAADGSFPQGHVYARASSPNRAALESALTALEGGATACAFASGSAATAAIFQALAPGDHVVAPFEMYWGTRVILSQIFARWGLEVSLVDTADLAELRRAIKPNTRLVWIETPSNPMLRVTDIAAAAELAHAAGARLACDNTFASPVLQRPLLLGADLVMHSTTKYFGGHSDLLGGAAIARADDDFFQRVRSAQAVGGAVPSAFDCWLLLRSIATLPYRVRAHSENAQKVAAFLTANPRVHAVHYPGLASHPGHAVAARQMKGGYGGVLSFQVTGGREAAMAVAARLQVITRATSLGGVESLIEHRASVESPDTKTPQDLLRLSVGLEHSDDLIADLSQALA